MKVAADVLRRLEWERIQAAVAEHARTPMGRERGLRMLPLGGPGEVLQVQERIEELRRLRDTEGRLPVVEVADPAPVLTVLDVRGRSLTGRDVFETVRTLVVARDVADAIRELDPDDYPELASEAQLFPDMEAVISAIHGNVSASGELEDHASPELGRIRREIRQLSDRLEQTLEEILRKESGGPVLRDRYYTVRSERYVVPVRTDTPRPFPGIVHGTSSTEKTLFVEPMETVEINNRLVGLREEERREVERILARYSAILRERREELSETIEALGAVDHLDAVASWADLEGAVRPRLVEGGGLVLHGGRHPLVEESLRHQSKRMVPIDVDMPRELRVLVISGPNAGGKTVALKTVGLHVLMAHAGLPVPAEDARLPLLGALFADIGDEQSIASSLSTFASHVRNLGIMVDRAEPPALCLVDEIGTGTDPAEGAALGTAVLDRLLSDGVLVVATTHHAAVKAWAYRSEGTLNAACEFDEATMRPTFRLVPGVAGSSIGLTMAEQMGLPGDVVERARARLDPSGAEAAKALDSVRTLASELERQRADIAEERRQLRAGVERERERLREEEERRRAEWERRVDALVAEFREESEELLRGLEDKKNKQRLDVQRARRERELRERYSEEAKAAKRQEAPPKDWTPQEGEEVVVATLGKEGRVKSVKGRKADVVLGRSVFTISVSDLRPRGEPGESATRDGGEPRARRPTLPGGVSAELSDKSVPLELQLLGYRVDEALGALDKYLDDASLAGHREVRIVHGFGTGRLKAAVRDHLSTHGAVTRWRDASPDEGGGGATVALLDEA